MSKEHKTGTFIHGIAASEHLDSSGERIDIAGVDISSLTKDGVFNFEHQSKDTNHLVGKILEAIKITKLSDCTNDHHKKFWNKIKMPFIYVAGELFDGVGHEAAQDVAAMLRYDNHIDKRKTKRLINFSIEGSRLGKDGSKITKCIARKVSITITPCNKVCEAEELKKPESAMKTKKSVIDKILGKSEENVVELFKDEKYSTKLLSHKVKPIKPSSARNYKKITPATGENRPARPTKPKRTFDTGNAPDKLRVGDRVNHKQNRPKTGASIYNDPDTFKSDEKGVHTPISKDPKGGKSKAGVLNGMKNQYQKEGNTRKEIYSEIDQKRQHAKVLSEQRKMPKPNLPKSDKNISNMRKALMAGSGTGSAGTQTGMAALSKESIVKVMKSISDDNWETFAKKEDIIDFLLVKLPNCSGKEILSLAKTVAYLHEKKKEEKLKEVLNG